MECQPYCYWCRITENVTECKLIWSINQFHIRWAKKVLLCPTFVQFPRITNRRHVRWAMVRCLLMSSQPASYRFYYTPPVSSQYHSQASWPVFVALDKQWQITKVDREHSKYECIEWNSHLTIPIWRTHDDLLFSHVFHIFLRYLDGCSYKFVIGII